LAESKHRFADAVADPTRRRLIAVREDHSGSGEAVNTIATICECRVSPPPGLCLCVGVSPRAHVRGCGHAPTHVSVVWKCMGLSARQTGCACVCLDVHACMRPHVHVWPTLPSLYHPPPLSLSLSLILSFTHTHTHTLSVGVCVCVCMCVKVYVYMSLSPSPTLGSHYACVACQRMVTHGFHTNDSKLVPLGQNGTLRALVAGNDLLQRPYAGLSWK
jgi:hypothetical protein